MSVIALISFTVNNRLLLNSFIDAVPIFQKNRKILKICKIIYTEEKICQITKLNAKINTALWKRNWFIQSMVYEWTLNIWCKWICWNSSVTKIKKNKAERFHHGPLHIGFASRKSMSIRRIEDTHTVDNSTCFPLKHIYEWNTSGCARIEIGEN